MKAQAEKLVDLEYDELIVLGVIESDADLTTVFREVTLLSFNILRTIAKQGGLNEETKEIMRGIFDSVILTKTEYIHMYQRYCDEGVPVKKDAIEEIVAPIVVAEPVVVEAKKEKKEGALPVWYGKQKIEEDIKNQGGKAKPSQIAALACNDLKNLFSSLNSRLIKDMLTENQALSDEDYRTITASIKMLKNKLEPIIKKK